MIEAIADDADMDLCCKVADPCHCDHSLLPSIKSCNHCLRPKGHIGPTNYPDVTLRCIKSYLYHVVFISNVFLSFLCSFLSPYCIHCLFPLFICTFVTCDIK